MDLILWRHAEAQEAEDGLDDLARPLTRRGEKQAARVGAWLDRQLPEGTRVLVSPALRAEQTARALQRKFRLHDELRPGASAKQLLELAGWPQGRAATLVVGHQPTLGEAVALLLGMSSPDCPVKKGAIWWLRGREREGQPQTTLIAVQSPDML
ncbi:MAG: phosphohistidine phosphatase SixA [Burkholderiaceae bacterium]|jgi:phosphohistidine phosphatase|nr:phosphohistidine phosphatase SixA [Burkholderiaceae bacterium]